MTNKTALFLAKELVEKLTWLQQNARLPQYQGNELAYMRKDANELYVEISKKCQFETDQGDFIRPL